MLPHCVIAGPAESKMHMNAEKSVSLVDSSLSKQSVRGTAGVKGGGGEERRKRGAQRKRAGPGCSKKIKYCLVI